MPAQYLAPHCPWTCMRRYNMQHMMHPQRAIELGEAGCALPPTPAFSTTVSTGMQENMHACCTCVPPLTCQYRAYQTSWNTCPTLCMDPMSLMPLATHSLREDFEPSAKPATLKWYAACALLMADFACVGPVGQDGSHMPHQMSSGAGFASQGVTIGGPMVHLYHVTCRRVADRGVWWHTGGASVGVT